MLQKVFARKYRGSDLGRRPHLRMKSGGPSRGERGATMCTGSSPSRKVRQQASTSCEKNTSSITIFSPAENCSITRVHVGSGNSALPVAGNGSVQRGNRQEQRKDQNQRDNRRGSSGNRLSHGNDSTREAAHCQPIIIIIMSHYASPLKETCFTFSQAS